ncbi:transcriptional regulator [Pseudoduganella flava]|uniref:Transcriptional regulator n=1 Tax=Pseudoduganella flava TaxID=871742 RepID=A0A562PDC7_9BURK|nr:winged helix-turn-helix domain-containing protein [Pseudoduganella flava]QGZ42186.1 hypothetical protein GO485_26175 [Pseudoduganella flava]TWI42431.1 transcriptional regulator [Pseudoduganella flava]
MTEFLLLGHDAGATHELRSILLQAGYEVIEICDIAASSREAGLDEAEAPARPDERGGQRAVLEKHHGIAVLKTGGGVREAQLRESILNLARQLTPGWRLNMRHHRLEAPNGQAVQLTSLEYNFIKIFALVEVGEAVSRKQIVKAFGEDYLSYDQNRIDTMVRRLRKKVLSQLRIKLPLNTERVRGFSFGDVLIIDP